MLHFERTNDIDNALKICHRVFVEEQNVPLDLEVDGLDDKAIHDMATFDGKAVATCRVRIIDQAAKIERVAVISACAVRVLAKK